MSFIATSEQDDSRIFSQLLLEHNPSLWNIGDKPYKLLYVRAGQLSYTLVVYSIQPVGNDYNQEIRVVNGKHIALKHQVFWFSSDDGWTNYRPDQTKPPPDDSGTLVKNLKEKFHPDTYKIIIPHKRILSNWWSDYTIPQDLTSPSF